MADLRVLKTVGCSRSKGCGENKRKLRRWKKLHLCVDLRGTSPCSTHSFSFLVNFHPSPGLPANIPAQVIVGTAKFTPHVFAFTADWANMGQYVPSQISEPKRFYIVGCSPKQRRYKSGLLIHISEDINFHWRGRMRETLEMEFLVLSSALDAIWSNPFHRTICNSALGIGPLLFCVIDWTSYHL